MDITRSSLLFERAKRVIPGGVNSPVRAFGAVGGTPRFIKRADAQHLWDEDGSCYLDFVGSWGPMLFGHNHPRVRAAVEHAVKDGLSFGAPTARETEIAELICSLVPGLEMVRMVNSGTEAVMSALRLARGYTGRPGIIKFDGCYHGHSDSMLVKAGSGVLTAAGEGGLPDSLGIPPELAADTLTAGYNDLESVRRLFAANSGRVAAVIVEPVAANMGVVPPAPGFLEGLRALCDADGALLIFDEVITGFRLAAGGAQEYFGVHADLVTYGKIIGGGMPVGAYGGSRAVMSRIAPLGGVYQAGTLSGNPIAMAAGLAQLSMIAEQPDLYARVERSAVVIADGLREIARQLGLPVTVNQTGSLVCAFFTAGPVECSAQAKQSDTRAYARYFNRMLEQGIYLAPSQFEAMFVSAAHTESDLHRFLDAAAQSLQQVEK